MSTEKTLQFRIITGSYEHSLLCLSVSIPLDQDTIKDDDDKKRQPHFQPIFHFQAHSLSIRSMDIAKRYLVTGSNDEHIRIYDLQKRKELGTLLQHQGSITKLLFSNEVDNDNKKDDNNDDDEDKNLEKNYPSHKKGKWLLSASEDGTILIWRTKDWEKFGILKGHHGAVNDLAIHPSGRIAISVGIDQTVRLWNLMTAKKASNLKLRGALTRGQTGSFIKFDSSGEFFIIGFRDRIMFWNTREAKMINLLGTNRMVIMDIQFISLDDNQEYLIIAFSNGSINFYEFNDKLFKPIDKDLKEIDGANLDNLPEPKWSLQGHASRVKGISIYKEFINNKLYTFMVSISSDGRIVVWNLAPKMMDQIAVYSTGERLNVVGTVQETIEKASTMKPIYNPNDENLKDIATDSEYESDGESLAHIMKGNKRKISKKKQRKERKKLLEVEME
jgi:protein MAK11